VSELAVVDCVTMSRFWKELGDMISRINEDDAYVDILRPDTMTKQQLDNKTRKKSDMVQQRTLVY